MGFAKYAEDNEEIMLERIRNRSYELRYGIRPLDNVKKQERRNEVPRLTRKETARCLAAR